MVRATDVTLFLVATKDGDCVGIMSAWVVPDRDYVWVDQCWYHPDLQGTVKGKQLMRDGEKLLKKFALKHGKNKLRMQTPKSARAWAKSWGYNELMTIMQKEITP
jgi:hypothetical protein